MSKVFSIVFNSRLNPEKLVLFNTSSVKNQDEAMTLGTGLTHKIFGDLQWRPVLQSSFDTPDLASAVQTSVPPIEFPKIYEIELTDSFLLKAIIDNQDKELYLASKKYLQDYHIKYIEDRLKVV